MTTTKKTTTKAKTVKTVKAKSSSSKIPVLPNIPFAYEVLDAASKQRSKAKKVEVLQKYKHPSLVTLFVWNYDTSIITLLPEGDVPYGNTGEDQQTTGTLSDKINDAVGKMGEMGSNSLGSQDQGKASIRGEYQKFYNFCKGGNPSLSNLRRETMFINILGGLHPLEAEILILVKDKKLESKYKIGKEVVSTAYPEIQWGDRS
tara:strand:- start:276 stop:884 length:609 start_codon:yes stop_codon:yes gene_type:complete